MSTFRKLLGGSGVIGLGAAAILLQSSIYNVDGGFRAVKFSRLSGVSNQVYSEGTHFMIPWLEHVTIYDVRAKPRSVASLTGTKGMPVLPILRS